MNIPLNEYGEMPKLDYWFHPLATRLYNIKIRSKVLLDSNYVDTIIHEDILSHLQTGIFGYDAKTVNAQLIFNLRLVNEIIADLHKEPFIQDNAIWSSPEDVTEQFQDELNFYKENLEALNENVKKKLDALNADISVTQEVKFDISSTNVSKIPAEYKPESLNKYQLVLLFDYLKSNDVIYNKLTHQAEALIISYLTGISAKVLQDQVMGLIDAIKSDREMSGAAPKVRTVPVNLSRLEEILKNILKEVQADIIIQENLIKSQNK
ncbi:MAG: hypothetical protein RIM99_06450 [Cyclobacteriaceae bacterium]